MCSEVREALLNYLDTDTIWCAYPHATGATNPSRYSFHHDDPPPLVELQRNHWDPLLEWARSTFDVDIQVFTSVLLHSQPARTKAKFNTILSEMNPWELAGECSLPVNESDGP